jgi:general secretion pathway protein D
MALVLCFSASRVVAGTTGGGVAVLVGAAGVSQAEGTSSPSDDKRQQAADLLRRARQAMRENDLPTAEMLISQAEALKVEYSPITMEDTPRKARQALEQIRNANSGASGPSGQGFSPPGAEPKAAPPSDPFYGRLSAPSDGTASPVVPLPPTADDQHLSPAPVRPAVPLGAGQRTQSDNLLRLSRRALAVGDVRRAVDRLNEAKRLDVQYGPMDDSPAKVEAAISKYQEIMTLDRNTDEGRRAYARMLMEESEALLRYGQLDEAEELAHRAAQQQVTYGPYEVRPQNLLEQIAVARRQSDTLIRPLPPPGDARPLAGSDNVAGVATVGEGPAAPPAVAAVYNPSQDSTYNVQAAAVQATPAAEPRPAEVSEPVPPPPDQPTPAASPPPASPPPSPAAAAPSAAPNSSPGTSPGYGLFQQGEAALRDHDRDKALQCFRQAAAYVNEMDPGTAQRLLDHLQLLSAPPPHVGQGAMGQPAVDETVAKQQALARQLLTELERQESAARSIVEKDPKGALALLEQERKRIEAAGLVPQYRDGLLKNCDRSLAEVQDFIARNGPRVELAERNNRIRQEIDREKQEKLDRQQKIASLVNEYNHLMDEQRWPEAEVVAKRAAELDPKNPVVVQLEVTSRLARALRESLKIKQEKDDGFNDALTSVDQADIPFDDRNPYRFPDPKDWRELTGRRSRLARERQRRRNEQEIEIEKKLRTPVSVGFKATPLSKVMEHLGRLADVNMHLDPQGLEQEGVSSDTPITIELGHEVMLKSALNLILEPLHLSYVVKDEVLKITSEQMRAGQVYAVTYNVADLVIPIPNFTGGPSMGLAGAYQSAMGSVSGTNPSGTVTTPLAMVASNKDSRQSGMINPAVLAQLPGTTGAGATTQQSNSPGSFGPGGAGGGANADFDSLIELIHSTVAPTTWDEVGGPGSIAKFETNLSLVISQTQEVHEEIVDLLEQLRRMQDLQVTIEVRFITLSDSFFERIGVDFDFNIASNIQNPSAAGFSGYQFNPNSATGASPIYNPSQNTGTAVVGLAPGSGVGSPASSLPPVFSSDLDIPFTQGSYALATPGFGNYTNAVGAGASMGFAILSDIEAYFFINAAQGDDRSNVLQAPKVTLFNGQQAFVSDTSQTPFVISVVPVVGDFAAAEQPVIVVLSEGTFMTVQAVVSNDRRFVRLTLVPFFSKITAVNEFTFTGTTSSQVDTTRSGLITQPNVFNNNVDSTITSTQGTTVQLPTFSFVTVTTTVSVPDGGTVLLGGIKRLSEERKEYGVPILDKIPYIDRLFKNTGIGRDTSSLMMMVTPRIIVQEEEEEKMGVPAP